MRTEVINKFAEELYQAAVNLSVIEPVTETDPEITLEDAYYISNKILERRIEAGEKVVGKKIGLTSKVVQEMLKVDQPDFGYVTDKMVYPSGASIELSKHLIQPRAEGEIAFVLKEDLVGPGVTVAAAHRAIDYVMPCFEIVDSRIKDWKIRIEDTVADNASCGMVILGDSKHELGSRNLATLGMVVEKNGEIVATGAGAASMGSPLNALVWLANTLGEYGIPLKAGEIILSGALVPLIDIKAGDVLRVDIGDIGSSSVSFR